MIHDNLPEVGLALEKYKAELKPHSSWHILIRDLQKAREDSLDMMGGDPLADLLKVTAESLCIPLLGFVTAFLPSSIEYAKRNPRIAEAFEGYISTEAREKSRNS